MNDQRQDLVLDGVDVAIRLGPLTDSTALGRKLTTLRRVVLAAPSYLEANGVPETPEALGGCHVISGPMGTAAGWTFRKGDRAVSVKLRSRLSVSLNEGAVAAAVAGLGVVATGSSHVMPEIVDGTLVRLLPDWEMDGIDVHAVYAGGRTAKPAARVFAEFLTSEFKSGGAIAAEPPGARSDPSGHVVASRVPELAAAH